MKSFAVALCACVLLSLAGRASAATITVNAGGDLQAAINAAQPGDTILLQAGAVFTGNYTLPVKNGTSYITIRSSAPDSSLPPSGTRITPAYAGSLAQVRSNQAGPAFATSGAATYWRLMFLEILPSVSTSAANLFRTPAQGCWLAVCSTRPITCKEPSSVTGSPRASARSSTKKPRSTRRSSQPTGRSSRSSDPRR